MPFELENIDLNAAANGEVGQQNRIENNVLKLLDKDLEQVAKSFTSGKEEQEKLIDGLQRLYEAVQNSPHLKGPQRKEIGQRFRLFVLLLDNRLERPLDSAIKNKADTLLSEIKRDFGEVPKQINTAHVELPEDDYLPPMMRENKARKTIKEWQKIVCKAPGRNAAGAEKTEFFDGPKVENQPTGNPPLK